VAGADGLLVPVPGLVPIARLGPRWRRSPRPRPGPRPGAWVALAAAGSAPGRSCSRCSCSGTRSGPPTGSPPCARPRPARPSPVRPPRSAAGGLPPDRGLHHHGVHADHDAVRAGSGGGVQPEDPYWIRTCSACILAQAAVSTVHGQSVNVAGVELQVVRCSCRACGRSGGGQCQGGQDAACGDRGADPESGCEDALGGMPCGSVWLVRISPRTAEPRLPPIVRTMALTLVAMPVCDAGRTQ
jgi:hypothetical protein